MKKKKLYKLQQMKKMRGEKKLFYIPHLT